MIICNYACYCAVFCLNQTDCRCFCKNLYTVLFRFLYQPRYQFTAAFHRHMRSGSRSGSLYKDQVFRIIHTQVHEPVQNVINVLRIEICPFRICDTFTSLIKIILQVLHIVLYTGFFLKFTAGYYQHCTRCQCRTAETGEFFQDYNICSVIGCLKCCSQSCTAGTDDHDIRVDGTFLTCLLRYFHFLKGINISASLSKSICDRSKECLSADRASTDCIHCKRLILQHIRNHMF